MAYRRSRGKAGKIQPAVQTMTFNYTAVANSNTTKVIDLSQCACLLNRRFYRQGLLWAVSRIKVFATPGATGQPTNGDVSVSKLPETWVMSNSWEKGFRAWQKMNENALEEAPSVKPKFLDFKIYMDAQHHQDGFGANLLPVNEGGPAIPGEWIPSKIVIPETTANPGQAVSREIIAVGPNNPGIGASGLDAKSLIEGYAASRALPHRQDPNTPDDATDDSENWLVTMFNEGTKQDDYVLTDLVTENDIPPYPFEGDGTNPDTMYPGGANQLSGLQLHDAELLTSTTLSNTVYLKGGSFPCGLMQLRFNNKADNFVVYTVMVDLVPGMHRGYTCAPMTEM